MKPGWNRIVLTMAGLLTAAAPAAAETPSADTNAKGAAPAKTETRSAPPAADDARAQPGRRPVAPEKAMARERFPYRYVGLGGTERGPEFIALTDGTTSFIARVGDVIGERYRITELRSAELVMTDLKTRKKGIVVAYKDIQSAPAELASPESAGTAAPRSPAAVLPPAVSTARSQPAEPARAPDAAAAPDEEEAPTPDLSAMISPPPVNKAEQALPMEILPPPDRNPMIVTTPAQDIPMITTPSRREHGPVLDIPLGPQQ